MNNRTLHGLWNCSIVNIVGPARQVVVRPWPVLCCAAGMGPWATAMLHFILIDIDRAIFNVFSQRKDSYALLRNLKQLVGVQAQLHTSPNVKEVA